MVHQTRHRSRDWLEGAEKPLQRRGPFRVRVGPDLARSFLAAPHPGVGRPQEEQAGMPAGLPSFRVFG